MGAHALEHVLDDVVAGLLDVEDGVLGHAAFARLVDEEILEAHGQSADHGAVEGAHNVANAEVSCFTISIRCVYEEDGM